MSYNSIFFDKLKEYNKSLENYILIYPDDRCYININDNIKFLHIKNLKINKYNYKFFSGIVHKIDINNITLITNTNKYKKIYMPNYLIYKYSKIDNFIL